MYCEAERIAGTITRLAGSILAEPDTELILVDDGSHDDTVAVAHDSLRATALDATVLVLPSNQGKGRAVQAGVLEATGDVVGYADADLSAGIDEILAVFGTVERGGADVAIASRAHADSRIVVHQPGMRQLSGKTFNFLLRMMRLTEFRDTQCGLKAFTRAAAAEVFHDLRVARFAFDVEVLARAEQLGYSIVEVPITWRHVEASRVSPVRDGTRMLRDAARLRAAVRTASTTKASMAPEIFDAMARVERTHWWFRAKRELVDDAVVGHVGPKRYALDVGCGTGALLETLASRFKVTIGTDLDPHALRLATSVGHESAPAVVARAEALPFRSRFADSVASLDVIEHIEDDRAALTEIIRTATPGALVVIAMPAYQWAWSAHDDRLGHRRRYTKRTAMELAQATGLEIERATYFHSWLVPLALLLRRTPLRRLMKEGAEEASFVSPTVNRVLAVVTKIERAVIRRVDVPFGLSVLVVGRTADAVDGAGAGA